MFWKKWTLQSKDRLLELSVGGRWYLGFTLALGVAAIYSGNNVIYLLESLLLCSLLLSGALSEYSVTRVRVSRLEGNTHAGSSSDDIFVVENLSRLPLYCLELGEYNGAERVFSAFLVFVAAGQSVKVRSRQVIPARGRHQWQGLLVATSFPFGFARKVRLVPSPGSRIVWPSRVQSVRMPSLERHSNRGEMEVVPGEVKPVEVGQDASRVHWPASMRAGQLMARPLRYTEQHHEVWLELRAPSPEMEARISSAAGALCVKAETLVMFAKGEPKVVQGRRRALDALALLPKEGA